MQYVVLTVNLHHFWHFVTQFSQGRNQGKEKPHGRLRAGLIDVKHRWTRKLSGRKQRDVAAGGVGASSQAVFLRN